MKIISPNIRLIFFPLLALIVLTSVILVTAGIFYQKIAFLRSSIESNSKEESQVQEKILVLESQQNLFSPFSEKLNLAFPSKNPALIVLSQVKKQAQDNGMILDNLKIEQGSKALVGDFYSVTISFDLSGNNLQLINFLQAVSLNAPINKIESLKYTASENEIERDKSLIKILTYWSQLPTNLPPVSQTVGQLSTEDKQILNNITTLNSFSNSKIVPQPIDLKRLDPFSY